MSAPGRLAVALLALAGPALAAAAPAAYAEEGGGPNVGGTVSSTLSLSLSEPSPFARASAAGRGTSVYASTVQVQATATDAPTRLTITDGEAIAGRRHGHMANGATILSSPLQAAAGDAPFRSLAAKVDPLLGQWSEPVSSVTATIRLRQSTRGSASALHKFHKLLLVTIAAAGP